MPGRKCIICGKSSLVTKKEGSNTSYFSFPRDENLRKKWIDVCHNKIENIVTARICSDHFKDEDFLHNNKTGNLEEKKKRLKFNVVPSSNLEVRSGKQTRNNLNNKNTSKENLNDSLKKKEYSRDSENIKDRTSVLQSKRKSSSGNKNNKHVKDQIKRKNVSENYKPPNLLPKQKIGKVLNNKENTKQLNKGKIYLKNNSQGIKEISKNKSEKELLKKKNKSVGNILVKKDLHRNKNTKKSINKENQMEVVGMKANPASVALKSISKVKLHRQVIHKSSKKESIRKKMNPESNSKHQNKSLIENNSKFPKVLTKLDTSSENNNEVISKEIINTKDVLETNISNAAVPENITIESNTNKKPMKRKSFLGNGIPRKINKKRIRLGKDDSDSEDTSSEYISTNNVTRDKITYKSPSEMADNVDLLKYFNYLKKKSNSIDQPILFWVDD